MIEILYRKCPKCAHLNSEDEKDCVKCGEYLNPITCMPELRAALQVDEKSDHGVPEDTNLPDLGQARTDESDVFKNFDEVMASSPAATDETPKHQNEVKVENKPEVDEPDERGARPFRLGLKTFNTEIELSKHIDRDFDSCRSLVNDTSRGDLTAWLLSRGHDINDIRGVTHDMSQTEEQRLESLRIFLNPDAPKPQLQTSKAEVSIGWAPQRSNGCSRKIILTNGGSGRLFGTARITGTPAEAFSIGRRPKQREVHVPISGDTTTLYVTSYSMRRRRRSRFQASLVVDTNGGRMDIPVHAEIAPSWVPAWTGRFALSPLFTFVLPIILMATVGISFLRHAVSGIGGGHAQEREVVIIEGGRQQGGKDGVELETGSTGTTLVTGQTGGAGQNHLSVAHRPSSIREVSDPVILRQIDGLLSNYFLYQQDNLLYAQKELYGEEVDFGNRGRITNYEVFEEKKAFLAAWPVPRHEKNGPLRVRYDEDTKRYLVDVETKYDWVNPDLRKGRRGRMMHSFELVRESGSTFRIVADHPKAISAQNTQPSIAAYTSPRPVPMPAPPQRDVAADTVRDILYPVLDGIVRSSTQRRRY